MLVSGHPTSQLHSEVLQGTFPNMSGKIALTISGNNDPKASSLYIVARTTLNIVPAARRVKRGLKRVHQIDA
jgi:hypothetical protein